MKHDLNKFKHDLSAQKSGIPYSPSQLGFQVSIAERQVSTDTLGNASVFGTGRLRLGISMSVNK